MNYAIEILRDALCREKSVRIDVRNELKFKKDWIKPDDTAFLKSRLELADERITQLKTAIDKLIKRRKKRW